MKNFCLLTGLVFFIAVTTCGQSSGLAISPDKAPLTKQLVIGDHMPHVEIQDMINYPSPALTFASLKGKFVILDFWSTGCTSCIEGFPRMKQIQEKFSNDLRVIMVDYESKAVIQKFLSLHEKLTGFKLGLPIAANNKILIDYFKPQGYPHFVWIDQEGQIRYITQADVVNEQNIQDAINGTELHMEFRNREMINWNNDKPLYVNGNGGDGKSIIYYSSISHRVGEFPTCGGYQDPGESGSHIFAYTSSIKGLFQFAFNDCINGYDLPNNRVILNVRDTSRYVWTVNGKTQWQNLYNYQLIAPFRNAEWLIKTERRDLMRYFGLEAHMEKRMMKCWVMTAEDTSLLISKGGFHMTGIFQKDYSLVVRNEPDSMLSFLFAYIIFGESPHPFVNEIHMKSHADLRLDSLDFNNQSIVIKALKEKYKINIHLEDHEVNMLIINEPGFEGIVSTPELNIVH